MLTNARFPAIRPCRPRLRAPLRSCLRPPLRSCPILLGLLLVGSAACTTTGAVNTLDARLNDQARRLTMQCYWQHEGERAVFGGMYVYQACRDWAHDVVRR
jgi:hypothetical protein